MERRWSEWHVQRVADGTGENGGMVAEIVAVIVAATIAVTVAMTVVIVSVNVIAAVLMIAVVMMTVVAIAAVNLNRVSNALAGFRVLGKPVLAWGIFWFQSGKNWKDCNFIINLKNTGF